MSGFQPYPLTYPAQTTTGVYGYTGNGAGEYGSPQTPGSFAGVTMTFGYPYSPGGQFGPPLTISSIYFSWWGQTEAGGTVSAGCDFNGVLPEGNAQSISIPFGCECTGITVLTTFSPQTTNYVVSGMTISYSGLNGSAQTYTLGSGTQSFPCNVQCVEKASVVVLGFIWYGFDFDGYTPTGFAFKLGTLPFQVAYGQVSSTGAIETSVYSETQVATSETATNSSASLEETTDLTATYTVATTQTTSDSNTVGTTTTLTMATEVSFTQDIVVEEASASETTTYAVAATTSQTQTFSTATTTTSTYTSEVSVTLAPGESAQLVVTGVYLSTPVTFSASGPATYTWYTFDAGETTVDVDNATLTFTGYQTTFGFTNSVAS